MTVPGSVCVAGHSGWETAVHKHQKRWYKACKCVQAPYLNIFSELEGGREGGRELEESRRKGEGQKGSGRIFFVSK